MQVVYYNLRKRITIMKKILYFILFFCLLSCTNKQKQKPASLKQKTDSITTTIDIKSAIEEPNKIRSFKLSTLLNDVKFVPLETSPSCLIGQVSDWRNQHFQITEEYFVIDLKLFNRNGSFARRIGRLGNGPTEYKSARDVTIDNYEKRIFVYSHWDHRILIYSYKGDLLKSIKDTLPTYQSGFVYAGSDELLLFSANNTGPIFELNQMNLSSNKINNLLKVDFSSSLETNGKFYFPPGSHWQTYNFNNILHLNVKSPMYIPESDLIYQYTNNKLCAKYHFDLGKYKKINNYYDKNKYSTYGFVKIIGESRGYLFFNFILKQGKTSKLYCFCYEKLSNTLKKINLSDNKISIRLFNRMIIDNEKLYTFIYPHELANEFSDKSAIKVFTESSQIITEFDSLSDGIDVNRNPIILIAQIK